MVTAPKTKANEHVQVDLQWTMKLVPRPRMMGTITPRRATSRRRPDGQHIPYVRFETDLEQQEDDAKLGKHLQRLIVLEIRQLLVTEQVEISPAIPRQEFAKYCRLAQPLKHVASQFGGEQENVSVIRTGATGLARTSRWLGKCGCYDGYDDGQSDSQNAFAGSIAFKTTTSRSETIATPLAILAYRFPRGLSKRSSGAASAQLHFGSHLIYGAAGCTPAGGRDGAVTTTGSRRSFMADAKKIAGELYSQRGNGQLKVPDHPIIPFIEGDGTGPDIWAQRAASSTPRWRRPTAASADRLEGSLRRREGLQADRQLAAR